MTVKKLIIMGFGGHSRSVADLALSCGYTELLFVDKNAQPKEHFQTHRVVQSLDALDDQCFDAFAASGDAIKRQEQCAILEKAGLSLVSLVSPLASIAPGSVILPGSFVGHHAHIGPDAKIGRSCIINTGAIVEHESSVGNYSHVSVNATIAGRSDLGAFSMLGAGGIIINELSVTNNVIIGAGAVVVSPITEPGTYVGVPAKKIINTPKVTT